VTSPHARDAENAAFSAAKFLSAVNAANTLVQQNTSRVVNLTDATTNEATDAENWANYSKAQAEEPDRAGRGSSRPGRITAQLVGPCRLLADQGADKRQNYNMGGSYRYGNDPDAQFTDDGLFSCSGNLPLLSGLCEHGAFHGKSATVVDRLQRRSHFAFATAIVKAAISSCRPE
jgi:hypothetical protein